MIVKYKVSDFAKDLNLSAKKVLVFQGLLFQII